MEWLILLAVLAVCGIGAQPHHDGSGTARSYRL